MSHYDTNAIIIAQICSKIEPGKKMLQKLMYLIGRKGVNLGLNYSIHYFGPYSSKLDTTMHTLESYDKLIIDTTGSTHIIRLGEVSIEGTLDEHTQTAVDFVMNNFSTKSAHELEAITTLDYVANSILVNPVQDSDIVDKVIQIKGSKFSNYYLNECLKELKQLKFIV